MSWVKPPSISIPTVDDSQRDSKAEQDNGATFAAPGVSQSSHCSTEAAFEVDSALMRAASPAAPLPDVDVDGGSEEKADGHTVEESLFPDELHLWKAASIFAQDPSLEELITILKVRHVSAQRFEQALTAYCSTLYTGPLDFRSECVKSTHPANWQKCIDHQLSCTFALSAHGFNLAALNAHWT